MPKYYPVNLLLKDAKCVVAGAGKVAERKARRLRECGARVFVIGPQASSGLKRMSREGTIVLKNRKVKLSDLAGAYLAISAADDRGANSRVSSYCRKKNILINVVDSPAECSFILPSVIRRGALTISVSTEGISPALAKSLRHDLEKAFGPEYAAFLRVMKKIRPRARKKIKSQKARKTFFEKILKGGTSRKIKCILRSIS